MPRHLHIENLGPEDGHTRITKAEDFSCRGGSSESHERIVEATLKMREDLSKKGRCIQTAEPTEVFERLS